MNKNRMRAVGLALTALIVLMLVSLPLSGWTAASPLRGITNLDSLELLGSLIFEGSTVDGFETTISATNATADRTITLPNSSGTVALNPYGESIEFEGATADGWETTLAVTDPTADRTVTLQNASGTVALTSQAVDMTLTADATGGNAGAKTEFIGLPRIKLVGGGAGTNGAAAGKTLALLDDSPAGEYAAHDADTTVTTDASYYKLGAGSLKVAFSAAADAGDGAHDTGTAYDFSDDESVGFFIYCDATLVAGDVIVDFTDDGGARQFNVPAYATANKWQWNEIDISGTANADKNAISDVSFELSAAGAAKAAGGAFNCYFDGAYKWDATEEEALGVAIQQDGVLSVIDTAGGTSLAEGTDYFVHYEATVDFIVYITDQSANEIVALVAY